MQRYLELAQKGHPLSMFLVALHYEHAKVTGINHEKALEWYKNAANLGQEDAIQRLVDVYANGELGEEVSRQSAQMWQEKLN